MRKIPRVPKDRLAAAEDHLRSLIHDLESASCLVVSELKEIAPFARQYAGGTLVGFVPAFIQDGVPYLGAVETMLSDFGSFQRLTDAAQNGHLRYEVRTLRSADDVAVMVDAPLDLDEDPVDLQAIFGFVGDYGAVCIRCHPRSNCIIVQLC